MSSPRLPIRRDDVLVGEPAGREDRRRHADLLAFDRIAEHRLLPRMAQRIKFPTKAVELGSATLELGGECPR